MSDKDSIRKKLVAALTHVDEPDDTGRINETVSRTRADLACMDILVSRLLGL